MPRYRGIKEFICNDGQCLGLRQNRGHDRLQPTGRTPPIRWDRLCDQRTMSGIFAQRQKDCWGVLAYVSMNHLQGA
jgi:hypothetical protein